MLLTTTVFAVEHGEAQERINPIPSRLEQCWPFGNWGKQRLDGSMIRSSSSSSKTFYDVCLTSFGHFFSLSLTQLHLPQPFCFILFEVKLLPNMQLTHSQRRDCLLLINGPYLYSHGAHDGSLVSFQSF